MWSKNVSTDKNFLRNILVTRGDPFVCACPRLRSSRCRQKIVESSSLYFWSIWEQHVFFLIIVHSRMKIYEVLKRASVHLPVVIHCSTGTTTNSASLVLKRVRMRSLESSVEHGDRFVSGCVHLLFDWKYFLVEENNAEKTCHKVFSGNCFKKVRIRCARRCCCKSSVEDGVYLPRYSPIIRLELPPCR